MSVCFYIVSMTLILAICNLRYYIYLHCLIHCIVTIFLKCTIKLCSIFCLIYFRVFVKIKLYQCQCQCQCQLLYMQVHFVLYSLLTINDLFLSENFALLFAECYDNVHKSISFDKGRMQFFCKLLMQNSISIARNVCVVTHYDHDYIINCNAFQFVCHKYFRKW